MRRYLLALPLLLAVFAFAACGSGSSGEPTPTIEPPTPEPSESATAAPTTAAGSTNSGTSVKVSGKLGAKPKITVPAGGDPPAKLVIKDIKPGTGPGAKAGQTVTVQYDGVLYKDGSQFDASWDHGQPFPFTLGEGSVIPGWDQGLVGMKKGGRRLLVIPPDLAYGANGSPPAIGPNETLVFVVDMEDITSS
jgi:peptidylprolyl isomerase